jgi:uncharacterized membrane protein
MKIAQQTHETNKIIQLLRSSEGIRWEIAQKAPPQQQANEASPNGIADSVPPPGDPTAQRAASPAAETSVANKPREERLAVGYPAPAGAHPGNGQVLPSGVAYSQMKQPAKPPLPRGIYVIVGLNALSFGLSFFHPVSNDIRFAIVTLVDLLVCAGLLLRMDVVRKIFVVVSVITVILSLFNVFGVFAVRSRADQAVARSRQAINQSTVSGPRCAALQHKQCQLDAKQAQVDHELSVVAAKMAFGVLVSAGEIIYLTRPGVREAFASVRN